MKTLITLLNKVYFGIKSFFNNVAIVEVVETIKEKSYDDMTEAEFDAWIVSIRKKPYFTSVVGTFTNEDVRRARSSSYRNDGLEDASCLVLA